MDVGSAVTSVQDSVMAVPERCLVLSLGCLRRVREVVIVCVVVQAYINTSQGWVCCFAILVFLHWGVVPFVCWCGVSLMLKPDMAVAAGRREDW